MITLYIVDLDTKEGQEYLQKIELNIISVDTPISIDSRITDGVTLTEPVYKQENHPIERKIGTTTFIVSSRFNKGNPCDIVSRIARLIQQDNENIPYFCG